MRVFSQKSPRFWRKTGGWVRYTSSYIFRKLAGQHTSPAAQSAGYPIEGRGLSSIVGTAIPFGGLTQNNLIPLNLALHHFLAKQAVKQHAAGRAPQLLGIVLHCGHRGRDTGQHLAVIQAGNAQIVRHQNMPVAQLTHDLIGNLIVTAEQAVRLLLKRCLQCINGLPC